MRRQRDAPRQMPQLPVAKVRIYLCYRWNEAIDLILLARNCVEATPKRKNGDLAMLTQHGSGQTLQRRVVVLFLFTLIYGFHRLRRPRSTTRPRSQISSQSSERLLVPRPGVAACEGPAETLPLSGIATSHGILQLAIARIRRPFDNSENVATSTSAANGLNRDFD